MNADARNAREQELREMFHKNYGQFELLYKTSIGSKPGVGDTPGVFLTTKIESILRMEFGEEPPRPA